MSPSRRAPTIAIAVTVVAMLILIVVADRIAPVIIGREVGATLQGALHTPERPEVSFGGFPFLTQVATSHYSSVRVSADQVRAGSGRPLRLHQVEVRLADVDAGEGYRRLEIGRAELRATIGYSELSRNLGRPVTPAEGGRVAIEMPLSVMVTGTPTIDDQGRFQLADAEFTLNGRELPEQLASRIPELPRTPVPSIGGVDVTDLTARQDGVMLSGHGENLQLTR